VGFPLLGGRKLRLNNLAASEKVLVIKWVFRSWETGN